MTNRNDSSNHFCGSCIHFLKSFKFLKIRDYDLILSIRFIFSQLDFNNLAGLIRKNAKQYFTLFGSDSSEKAYTKVIYIERISHSRYCILLLSK